MYVKIFERNYVQKIFSKRFVLRGCILIATKPAPPVVWLCAADNCRKIWPNCGHHDFMYTERKMNKSCIYNFLGRGRAIGMATRYGLAFWDRIPVGGGIFCTLPDRSLSPPSLPCKWYLVCFLWIKRPGHRVDHPPHLMPKLKKEQSYTSTPPWDLHGLLWGRL